MKYHYIISYESDTQPVVTIRGDYEAGNRATAIRKGARAAVANWPKGRTFRSWVICVERADSEGDSPETPEVTELQAGFIG